MKKFSRFSHSQAWYLWRKLCSGNITQAFIERLCTYDGLSDLFGGWFADFHYDALLDSWLSRD